MGQSKTLQQILRGFLAHRDPGYGRTLSGVLTMSVGCD